MGGQTRTRHAPDNIVLDSIWQESPLNDCLTPFLTDYVFVVCDFHCAIKPTQTHIASTKNKNRYVYIYVFIDLSDCSIVGYPSNHWADTFSILREIFRENRKMSFLIIWSNGMLVISKSNQYTLPFLSCRSCLWKCQIWVLSNGPWSQTGRHCAMSREESNLLNLYTHKKNVMWHLYTLKCDLTPWNSTLHHEMRHLYTQLKCDISLYTQTPGNATAYDILGGFHKSTAWLSTDTNSKGKVKKGFSQMKKPVSLKRHNRRQAKLKLTQRSIVPVNEVNIFCAIFVSLTFTNSIHIQQYVMPETRAEWVGIGWGDYRRY